MPCRVLSTMNGRLLANAPEPAPLPELRSLGAAGMSSVADALLSSLETFHLTPESAPHLRPRIKARYSPAGERAALAPSD